MGLNIADVGSYAKLDRTVFYTKLFYIFTY